MTAVLEGAVHAAGNFLQRTKKGLCKPQVNVAAKNAASSIVGSGVRTRHNFSFPRMVFLWMRSRNVVDWLSPLSDQYMLYPSEIFSNLLSICCSHLRGFFFLRLPCFEVRMLTLVQYYIGCEFTVIT